MLWGAASWYWLRPPMWLILCMMVPMVADGFIQLLLKRESTNLRRVVTGFLFGWALVCFICRTTAAAFWFGYHLKKN